MASLSVHMDGSLTVLMRVDLPIVSGALITE